MYLLHFDGDRTDIVTRKSFIRRQCNATETEVETIYIAFGATDAICSFASFRQRLKPMRHFIQSLR